jgi:hypothetical protein
MISSLGLQTKQKKARGGINISSRYAMRWLIVAGGGVNDTISTINFNSLRLLINCGCYQGKNFFRAELPAGQDRQFIKQWC